MVHCTTVFKLLMLCCLVLLQACSFQQYKVNLLANNLPARGAFETLKALEQITPDDRDLAQYLLNLGRLKSITGDIDGSIINLQEAKDVMISLQATSVSENISAVTINDTLRSYTGMPSERVLVHIMLAYNYLKLGELYSARVEMLQANVTMQELSKEDSLSGQLASAHFTSGIIYELNGEWDDAMISYRRAIEIMDENKQPIPRALQESLLQTSFRQGFREEYNRYVERFSRKAQRINSNDSELIIFYADGKVSNLQQDIVRVFSPAAGQLISLAVPYYPPSNYQPQFFTINLSGKSYRTEIMENIEKRTRENLAEELPRITATALARAAIKYNAVKASQKQGDFAQILVNVAAAATETADTRSWNMLPSSLQIARVKIENGLESNQSRLIQGLNEESVISFDSGKKLILLTDGIGY